MAGREITPTKKKVEILKDTKRVVTFTARFHKAADCNCAAKVAGVKSPLLCMDFTADCSEEDGTGYQVARVRTIDTVQNLERSFMYAVAMVRGTMPEGYTDAEIDRTDERIYGENASNDDFFTRDESKIKPYKEDLA